MATRSPITSASDTLAVSISAGNSTPPADMVKPTTKEKQESKPAEQGEKPAAKEYAEAKAKENEPSAPPPTQKKTYKTSSSPKKRRETRTFPYLVAAGLAVAVAAAVWLLTKK